MVRLGAFKFTEMQGEVLSIFVRPSRFAISTAVAAAMLGVVGLGAPAHAETHEAKEVMAQIQEADGVTDAGRVSVLDAFHASTRAKSMVKELIEPTLDLSDALATGPASPDQASVLGSLPTVDSSSIGVSLPAPNGAPRGLSIALQGSRTSRSSDGVATGSNGPGTRAFSHITESQGGQIVAVVDDPSRTKHLDFAVDLAQGMSLDPSTDGSLTIVDGNKVPLGAIKRPWAVDSVGKNLPTRYELTSFGFRQHVDGSTATGSVVLDPSVWWWVATTAKCAAEIAPVVASGGVLAGAKATRMISKINGAVKKSAAVKKAVSSVGGVKNAATAVFKKAYSTLKNKLPSYVKGKLPSLSMTTQQAAAGGVILGWIGNQIWDWLGFGSCNALFREVF